MALSQGIAFIGGGNMATALIQGLIATHTARREQLLVSDIRAEGLVQLRDKYGVRTTLDSRAACQSDILVLSVKPQNFAGLLPTIAQHLAPSTLVISIAAGVPLRAIEAALPQSRVVRAMPNTPALVSAGATALAPGSKASQEDMALATKIFASVGQVVQVEEAHLDAVTALSGSGPAYVFLMAEALASAGAELGLTPEVARVLAAQTIFGAGKLLAESPDAPAELRRKVTSPGGTTAAGLAALEARDFAGAITACLRAANARGQELGQETANSLGMSKARS
jgi:pyrroline-5-carboxylate reductase